MVSPSPLRASPKKIRPRPSIAGHTSSLELEKREYKPLDGFREVKNPYFTGKKSRTKEGTKS
jgi:hypothetical protein